MKRTFLFDAGSATDGASGPTDGKVVAAQLKGQATPEEIAKWKENNRDGIYGLCNETDIAYFREPTRHDINKSYAVADDSKQLAGIEEFARLTYLGGSREMLTNDKMFLGMTKALKAKMGGITATVVNI